MVEGCLETYYNFYSNTAIKSIKEIIKFLNSCENKECRSRDLFSLLIGMEIIKSPSQLDRVLKVLVCDGVLERYEVLGSKERGKTPIIYKLVRDVPVWLEK